MNAAHFERAREEIAYAAEKVPFFRTHLESVHVRPADLRTPADLARIPPTQKAHYRRNFPVGVLAEGFSLQSPNLVRTQSSGTEGERLVSVGDSFLLAQRMANTIAINPRFAFLFKTGALRTCRYAAPNCSDVECSNPNTTMADRIVDGGTLILPVYHDLLTTPAAMFDAAVNEIRAHDPRLLYVDPTHLSVLIRHLQATGQTAPKTRGVAIHASYTLCAAIHRRRIRAFFGPDVPFANVVAMSEFGYLGIECTEGKVHFDDEDYYLELIVDGRPAEPGDLAELYVTSLGDVVSPHIRYRTGDLYRLLPDGCACGNTGPAVSVEGRARNTLHLPGDRVMTPRELDDLVGDVDWLDLYQMEQETEESFVFAYVPSARPDAAAEQDLRARLTERLAPGRLRFQAVSYIAGERGGKFLSCRSRVAARRAA